MLEESGHNPWQKTAYNILYFCRLLTVREVLDLAGKVDPGKESADSKLAKKCWKNQGTIRGKKHDLTHCISVVY